MLELPMIFIEEIIQHYQDIVFLDVYNKKRDDVYLKPLIQNFCRNLHISEGLAGNFNSNFLYDYHGSLSSKKGWSTVRQAINQFFKDNNKVVKIKFEDYSEFIVGHLIESLCAFERSIFWFFNYKHNFDPFNRVASEQALYYSEFFSIVAITRFLGGSLNHTPLGLFKINLQWKNEIISINHKPKSRSSHGSYSNLFYELMDEMDFTNYEYFKRLRDNSWMRKKGFLMIEDRKENVYDLTSRTGDPFKNALYGDLHEMSIGASRSWNFLESIEEIYDRTGQNDYDGGLAEFLQREYEDIGYREDHIGEYWRFLINSLKNINNINFYFDNLTSKISRYEECKSVELDENTKRILFKWINED